MTENNETDLSMLDQAYSVFSNYGLERLGVTGSGDRPTWNLENMDVEKASGVPNYILDTFNKSLGGVEMEVRERLWDETRRILKFQEYPNNPDRFSKVGIHEFLKHIGTVQGSALSPYLANICLAEMSTVLPKGAKILQYADDAIIYGEENLEKYIEYGHLLRNLQRIGLNLNVEKSGWVRKVEWKTSLKFLGIKYIPETNGLEASTRKGSTLPFTKRQLLHAEYDIKYLMNTSIFGIHEVIENLDKMRKVYNKLALTTGLET